jgi:hypothetical protein
MRDNAFFIWAIVIWFLAFLFYYYYLQPFLNGVLRSMLWVSFSKETELMAFPAHLTDFIRGGS